MARIVKFPVNQKPSRIGYQKVRKRKKVNLEDYGQLNLFTRPQPEARVVDMHAHGSPFEQALHFDEQNEKDIAVKYYHQAITVGESTADAYCNLGIIESEKRNFTKAISHFTHCLKEDPRHYEAHYNLANVYSEAGNLELARVHYEIAIEIEPDFTSAYYNLGLVMALTNHFKDAIDILIRYKGMVEEYERVNADRLINSLRKTIAKTS